MAFQSSGFVPKCVTGQQMAHNREDASHYLVI